MPDADPNILSPVRQETAPLRRLIISSIRRAIENGTLPHGSRLIERDLCEQLNVSRTSLRESLRELEAEGLIGRQGKRGLVVTKITAPEAENIYKVRAVLEALVAEQFATNPDPAALSKLRELVNDLAAAYLEGDMGEILDTKRKFYEGLCTGAGNAIVLDILQRLNSRISQLRSSSLSTANRRPRSIEEVNALVDAIASGNVAEARKMALLHVSNAAEIALGKKLKITKMSNENE
ncbi:GntR family transcriptional regulator [Hoeflea sp. CAU 1731]